MQFFYTVLPGDTLYQIAKRWGLPVNSLIAASNLLPPYTIFPGQQLSIPPSVNVLRVQPGDTIFRISQLYKVPMSVIIEANQLQPPYTIQVGQLLKVPPGLPYYVVQPGDTLYQIAGRYNVTTRGKRNYELIMQVNNLSSTNLLPGMQLLIPYAPPGDKGLIAYTSNRGGHYDIWLYNPVNGVNVQLTNELGDSFSIPVWSAAGSIAFVGKNRILYIIHVTTGSIARIDQLEEGADFSLDWSPDGKKLAYTKQNHIILYDVMTHQPQRIQQPNSSNIQWFPSGVELLFQAPDESGISQLFRIHTNGTGKQQLTRNTNGPLHNAQLSPDGNFVLYTTPGVSISIIETVELSTGNVFEVKGGPLVKNYFPQWSPDSMRIAYTATVFDERRGYYSQVRSVGRRGENERIEAISNCFAAPVTWSPNGRKIAYLSGCKEQESANEMWGLDTNHPVPIQLIKGVTITSLQWSPSSTITLPKKIYTSTAYKVRLRYPPHWQRVNEERYQGSDGFFQISAISAGENLHEVCLGEAFQQLMPYGSAPRIFKSQIQNQESCYIFPSTDQPAEMMRQAALIVKYPKPIHIEGTTYNYFILWADEQHMNELASTLTFLP